jgi:rhodanese-related sulfurtransferase
VTEIKTDEVVALIEKGPKAGNYLLVDARPAKVASAGHIPTAISIPVNVLKKKGEKLLPSDKNTMLIFYCGGPT